ncbi:hypothetical protein ACFQZ1_09600 [Bacillus sp. CGMCC 1.60114]
MLSINFHLGVPPNIYSIRLVSSGLFSSTVSINGSNSSTDALIPNKQETAIRKNHLSPYSTKLPLSLHKNLKEEEKN